MTITLELPKSIEQAIQERAQSHGMAVPDYARDLLIRGITEDKPLREKNRQALELLASWNNVSNEDIAEQRETWEFLQKALDEDRLSYRKLFPKKETE